MTSHPEGRPGLAVVLMNMGAPDGPADIVPYRRRLLADPMMVRLPAGRVWQPLFARMVARLSAGSAGRRYRAIGGTSPLLAGTRAQADRLSVRLGVPVVVAMRYSRPDARDAAAELATLGVERVVGLSMYPQYCSCTSGSSIAQFEEAFPDPSRRLVIDRHWGDPGFAEAMAGGLRRAVAGLGEGSAHVLFVAHSVPVRLTRGGDPYVSEVEGTMEAVCACAGVGLPGSLAFQSASGPGEWHGPTAEAEVLRLAAEGVERLVVVPLSFACENLETLYDLDVVCARMCREAGVKEFARVGAPGVAREYVDGLARVVAGRVEGRWGDDA